MATDEHNTLWGFMLCWGIIQNLFPRALIRVLGRGVIRGKEPTGDELLILRAAGLAMAIFAAKALRVF